MKEISKSLNDTEKIAATFLETLIVKPDGAPVIGLFGDLGAGKTTFSQAIAKLLGVKETVTSPTFIIEKIYKLKENQFSHLIHIDAYRLESGKELTQLGWHELIANNKNLILLEWPEKVSDIVPNDMRKVSFKFIDETTREIEF